MHAHTCKGTYTRTHTQIEKETHTERHIERNTERGIDREEGDLIENNSNCFSKLFHSQSPDFLVVTD